MVRKKNLNYNSAKKEEMSRTVRHITNCKKKQ